MSWSRCCPSSPDPATAFTEQVPVRSLKNRDYRGPGAERFMPDPVCNWGTPLASQTFQTSLCPYRLRCDLRVRTGQRRRGPYLTCLRRCLLRRGAVLPESPCHGQFHNSAPLSDPQQVKIETPSASEQITDENRSLTLPTFSLALCSGNIEPAVTPPRLPSSPPENEPQISLSHPPPAFRGR